MEEWRVPSPSQFNSMGHLSSKSLQSSGKDALTPNSLSTFPSEESSLSEHGVLIHSVSALDLKGMVWGIPQRKIYNKNQWVWKIRIFVQPASLAEWLWMALPRITNYSVQHQQFSSLQNEITDTLMSQESLYGWIGNKGRNQSEPFTDHCEGPIMIS